MLRYRTEIEIPADRYVHLLLPGDFPEGRATVTVFCQETRPGNTPDETDPDREDIEWWEEFDDDPEPAD